jgi:hypothetical protein
MERGIPLLPIVQKEQQALFEMLIDTLPKRNECVKQEMIEALAMVSSAVPDENARTICEYIKTQTQEMTLMKTQK